MKSVLIVDDEYYIRVRVRKCVNWRALGFDPVVDCGNGKEALALMEGQSFDLVVLDISMPVMDGLALCREIRARRDPAQLIILTGYDKFEYARSALAYDVVDYILKPVDGDEVETAVKKALERMERDSSYKAQMEEWTALKSQADRLQTDLFFSSILTDSFLARPDMAPKLRACGVEADRRYAVAYFQGDEVPAEFQPKNRACLGVRLPQGGAWIVEEGEAEALERFLEAAPSSPRPPAAGVSALHAGTPAQLQAAYMEACLIFGQRLMEKGKRVFRYLDYMGSRSLLGAAALSARRDALTTALRQRDGQRVKAALNEAFACLEENQNSVFGLYLFVEGLLQDIQKVGLYSGSEWDETALFRMQALDMIQTSDTLDALKGRLTELFARCVERSHAGTANAGTLLVSKVRRLVEGHYMEADLTPGAIAQALSLNASYLSDTFRRFGGQTLGQLITQVRMEKAKELLSCGKGSLADVMEQVGYKDPYYFSKRFKKYFGFSPSAYRWESVPVSGESGEEGARPER